MANNNTISDESLAAFLDGNVDEQELSQILQLASQDKEVRETLDIALQLEDRSTFTEELPMLRIAESSHENLCAALCEAYIMHRRGISYDWNKHIQLARKKQWLKKEGTPLYAIGQLLATMGLMVTRQYGCELADIKEALRLDNDVIVIINDSKNENNNEPNHAVVVISLDKDNILLFDPNSESSNTDMRIEDFKKVWHSSSNYMVRCLRSVNEYQPSPIDLNDIELSDKILELREAIAENAHNVWARARMDEGWRYGQERNDLLKLHPDLVPYSSLPESEKEYDRNMAMETVKLLIKLGYIIKK